MLTHDSREKRGPAEAPRSLIDTLHTHLLLLVRLSLFSCAYDSIRLRLVPRPDALPTNSNILTPTYLSPSPRSLNACAFEAEKGRHRRQSISRSVNTAAEKKTRCTFYSTTRPCLKCANTQSPVRARDIANADLGSLTTGKSSLAVQFVDGHFVESYYPTIENTFSKVIRFRSQDYATEIVDTAGQVREGSPSRIPCSLKADHVPSSRMNTVF